MRFPKAGALLWLLPLAGCGVFRQSPKYAFADGVYKSNALRHGSEKVFVHNEGDTVFVYPLKRTQTGYAVDTAETKPLVLEPTGNGQGAVNNPWFRQHSFDVDFLTIPFKYRFPVGNFPRQFTSNINGAVYLGYRSDAYVIRYPATLLGKSNRDVNHFGFSFGGFTGLGATAMNPWVTANAIDIEYDGVVWSKGVAGIAALNNFTAGLAFGWDHLFDRNRAFWIYQGKPWVGFVFGLNLN